MLGSLHKRVEALASWPNVALLLVALFACLQGFAWRQRWMEPSPEVPDARFGYTPGELQALFEAWGQGRRQAYALTQVTLDGAFPVVYGALFAGCVVRLFTGRRSRWLVVVPLLTSVADLSENVLLAILAWNYDGRESPMAWVAAVLTVTKLGCFIASLLLLIIGGVAGLRRSATNA